MKHPQSYAALIDAILITSVRSRDIQTLEQALKLSAANHLPLSWVTHRVGSYLKRFELAEAER